MGCNCGKNQSRPAGAEAAMTASRQQAQAAADARAAEARAANHSTSRIGPAKAEQGGTQSFALRTQDGRTQSFGSLLEARAERERAGGGVITPG